MHRLGTYWLLPECPLRAVALGPLVSPLAVPTQKYRQSWNLVALYLHPPVTAAVFALDEKSQIQTPDRTAPTLPILPTTPQRATR